MKNPPLQHAKDQDKKRRIIHENKNRGRKGEYIYIPACSPLLAVSARASASALLALTVEFALLLRMPYTLALASLAPTVELALLLPTPYTLALSSLALTVELALLLHQCLIRQHQRQSWTTVGGGGGGGSNPMFITQFEPLALANDPVCDTYENASLRRLFCAQSSLPLLPCDRHTKFT